MGADHHDLVAQHRIGPGQFREHVVRLAAFVVVEARRDIDADLHGRTRGLQHPRDHVVVLGSERDGRHGPRTAVASGDEHRSVFADARLQNRGCAGLAQCLRDALCRRRRTAAAGSSAALTGAGRIRRRHRHVVRIARLRPILAHEGRHRRLREDDGAFELSGECGDLFRALAADRHRGRRYLSGHCGRPAVGVRDEREVARFDHFDRELLQLPAAAELPGLQVHVRQPVRRQPIPRPLHGALVRGRGGQPRTDVDGKVTEDGGGLGALESFRADARQHVPLGRRLRCDNTRQQKQEHNCFRHGARF